MARRPINIFGGGTGGGVANPAVSADKTTTSGTGVKPNSTVTVYKNGTSAGTATANGSGAWTFSFGSALAVGDIVTYDAILTSPAYTVPSPTPTAPAAPTISLTAGNGQVSIAWTDGAANGAAITSHKLYRGTASGSRTLVGTIGTTSPFVDTGLTNGTAYFYSLSAVNSVGEGAQSTEASATPAAGAAAPANSYNWSPTTQFANTLAAAQNSSVGRIIGVAVGDSTTAGFQDTGGGGTDGFRATVSYPARVAAHLNTSNYNSYCATGNYGVVNTGGNNDADLRVTVVAGGKASGAQSLAGPLYQTSAAGDGFDFATSGTFDRVRVTYVDTGGGLLDIGTNGGALSGSPTTATATGNLLTKTFSVTRGTGTINLRQTNTGTGYIMCVEAWDSQTKTIDIINAGQGGATSAILSGNLTGYTPVAGVAALAPHFVILNIGINDGNTASTSKATFKANVLNAVTKWQSRNIDVLLTVTTPVVATSAMETTYWTQYRDALQEIAVAQNVPIITNWHDRYVSWNTQNAKTPTWMAGQLHPAAPLYDDEGAVVAQILASVINPVLPAISYKP